LGEDIGLATFSCKYSNFLPEAGIPAKTLLHSTELKYNSFVIIDSCFTGIQNLRVLGVRTGEYRRIPDTEDGTIPPGPSKDVRYIKIYQGIYGGNSAVIPKEPQIREGVCGTPLMVAGRNRREMAQVLKDGIVAGFMSWNDIDGADGQIYSFCQTADPLIEAGWVVSKERILDEVDMLWRQVC
jgi:hypothetical protein